LSSGSRSYFENSCHWIPLYFSDWPTIPQLYVKGQFIGGADILLDMFRNGELQELLLKEGIITADSGMEPS
jgi:monothiol glutaredoxin